MISTLDEIFNEIFMNFLHPFLLLSSPSQVVSPSLCIGNFSPLNFDRGKIYFCSGKEKTSLRNLMHFAAFCRWSMTSWGKCRGSCLASSADTVAPSLSCFNKFFFRFVFVFHHSREAITAQQEAGNSSGNFPHDYCIAICCTLQTITAVSALFNLVKTESVMLVLQASISHRWCDKSDV